MTIPASKTPVLKAAIDSRSLSIELFGSGRSRHQRKLVYNYLATWANPDGSSSYPSLTTIARDNGLTRRGLIRIIQWLLDHGLLRKHDDRSPRNTNNYTVLFSLDDQERCRQALKRDAEEQTLSGKRNKSHQGRVLGGRRAAAKRLASSDSQQSPTNTLDSDSQQSPCPSDCTSHPTGDSRAGMVTDELPNGDSQQSHDRPSLPSLNRQAPSNQPSVDWLVGWLSSLLKTKTDKTAVLTASERASLLALQDTALTCDILNGFISFLDRPSGVSGLSYPFSVFFKEADAHISSACQSTVQGNFPSSLTTLVQNNAAEFDYRLSPYTLKALCHLLETEGYLREDSGYNTRLLRRYFIAHSNNRTFSRFGQANELEAALGD